MNDYDIFDAPVRGGRLHGGVWHPDAAGIPVLAIHGITASHMCWPLVAELLPDVRIIAPDLRGRGRSNALPAPWGMRDHADDMARVLDHAGVDRAVVVGHSMGGFVAVRLAAQHPDRISAVVLLDGGLPLLATLPTDTPAADIPALLLGPAGERLTRRYPDRGSYTRFWRQHPAFAGVWNGTIAAYVDYDLEPTGGGFRPSSRLEPVKANVVQMGGDDGYWAALAGIGTSVDFLRAPRDLLGRIPGLYSDEAVARAVHSAPGVRVHPLRDVNHYTMLMTPEGAAQVAPFIDNATHPVAVVGTEAER